MNIGTENEFHLIQICKLSGASCVNVENVKSL